MNNEAFKMKIVDLAVLTFDSVLIFHDFPCALISKFGLKMYPINVLKIILPLFQNDCLISILCVFSRRSIFLMY